MTTFASHVALWQLDPGRTRNEYFLYAQLLAYASARPRQTDRAEATFRKAYAKGLEANKHAPWAVFISGCGNDSHIWLWSCQQSITAGPC